MNKLFFFLFCGLLYPATLLSRDREEQQVNTIIIVTSDPDLKINGGTSLVKVKIDWGDGSVEELLVSGSRAASHVFLDQPPPYTVTVTGYLTELRLGFTTKENVTSVDARNHTTLNKLDVSRVQLKELKVSGANKLTDLRCNNNQLTSLDLTGCIALTYLSCTQNQLTALDLTGLNALKEVFCVNNYMSSAALNQLFHSLNSSAGIGNKRIHIATNGAPGKPRNAARDCDISIAKNKGWSVF